jgi:type II restriction/modification system DNA methylase subunit YeeA
MLPPKPDQPKMQVDTKAIALCNELAYEILIKHPKAKQYMKLFEEFLMKPVLPFGKDIAWGYGNEGRNDFIRGLINGAHKYMNEQIKTDEAKTLKRDRKTK